MTIPDSHRDLLKDEVKAFAVLATMMQNCAPQATPVWFSWDGEYFLVNSASGRVKDRNMREHPYVALTILDPTNPYRYMQVRGVVMGVTTEGAYEHIDQLAHKYLGKQYYDGEPTETRVIYRIKPESVSAFG